MGDAFDVKNCRAITISNPAVAYAMLKGFKPFETRARIFPTGWYFLHIGAPSVRSESARALQRLCADALRVTWPNAPSNTELPVSSIIGCVYLGKVAKAANITNPWVIPGYGDKCHMIEKVIEFANVVPNVKGTQNVWYVKNSETLQALSSELQSSCIQTLPDRFPLCEDERSKKTDRAWNLRSGPCRVVTIRNPVEAYAMLKGFKPLDCRRKLIPKGWYFLYIGAQSVNSESSQTLQPLCANALQATWPQAPSAAELPTSAIVGRVCFGRVAKAATITNPWVIPGCGDKCHIIEKVVEFANVIPHLDSQRGVWYVRNPRKREALESELQRSTIRTLPDLFPRCEDERSKKTNQHSGMRQSRKRTTAPESEDIARKRRRTWVNMQRPRTVLNDPSTLRGANAPARTELPNVPAVPVRGTGIGTSAVQRVIVGRSWLRLLHLMQQHFLADTVPFTRSVVSTSPLPG